MNTSSLVSIVIPAFNAANSISRCLDSCLEQTYSNIEIIVINDGSTDDTELLVREYGTRIKYHSQENSGQAAARNIGIKSLTGEYVVFLDADDYLEPDFVLSCLAYLQAKPHLVAVHTMLRVKTNGKEDIRPVELSGIQMPFEPGNFLKFWAKYGNVQTGAMLIRTSAIRNAGFQNEALRVSQDWEYWLLITLQGPWGYIPQPLYVNDSERNAKGNWMGRYSTRRKMCPTVEMWEERLVDKFAGENEKYYRVIRGDVALGYAHNHILSRRFDVAHNIVIKYGQDMRENRLSNFLKRCASSKIAWFLAVRTLIVKEYIKAYRMSK